MSCSRSRTVTRAPRSSSSLATARPTMPAPTTTTSVAAVALPLLGRRAGGEQLEVGVDHQLHEVLERGPRLPAELVLRLRVVADQVLDLGWAEELRVDPDVVAGVL